MEVVKEDVTIRLTEEERGALEDVLEQWRAWQEDMEPEHRSVNCAFITSLYMAL